MSTVGRPSVRLPSQTSTPQSLALANATRVRAASARLTEKVATSSRPCQSSPPQLAARCAAPVVGQGATSSYSRSLSPKDSVQTTYGNKFSPRAVQTTYGNRSSAAVVGNRSCVITAVKQDEPVSPGRMYSTSSAIPQGSSFYSPVQTSYGCPPFRQTSMASYVACSVPSSLPLAEEEQARKAGLPVSVGSYRQVSQGAPQQYSRTRASLARSASPPPIPVLPQPPSVECKVLLTSQAHNCILELARDTSVDEAISQATRQVLRNVVESRGELGPIGEHISVTPLPSANGASTIGEWVASNLGHAPAVVVKSNESDWEAPPRTEVGQEDSLRHLQQEHAQMMATLQKVLQQQSRTIEQQATFIDDLQEQEQKCKNVWGAMARIKVDIAEINGESLRIEEQLTSSENVQQNPTQ